VTNAASIVADFRRAIALLAELNDPASTHAAAALSRWLAGEEFDSAAGLAPGWRSHMRISVRDRALGALVAMHADMDDSALADWIVEGFERVATKSVRPDGADGYLVDLVRAGCILSQRHWRRLISGHRGC
jgi:hypothetical protein